MNSLKTNIQKIYNRSNLIISLFVKYSSIFMIFTIITFSLFANFDFSSGHYLLFMDDRITFDEIRLILSSNNLDEIVNLVVFGDQRYGRTVFYIPALFSTYTFEAFGDRGIIVTQRLINSIFIILTAFILSKLVVKKQALIFLLSALCLTIPYSDYYFTSPKPEPIQLFFIAVFLYFFLKKYLNPYSWFFLGVAVGTKVSAVFVLPTVGLIYCFFLTVNNDGNSLIKNIILFFKSVISFIVGFLAAVPFIAFSLENIKTYVNTIIQNSKHAADNDQINLLTWLDYFPKLFENKITFYIFTLLSILSIFLFIYQSFKLKYSEGFKIYIDNNINNIAFILIGFTWFFGITLTVERLWGFYLYPAILFFILGFSGLLLNYFNDKKNFFTSIFGLTLLFCATLETLSQVKKYERLGNRSNSMHHKKQLERYKKMVEFLDQDIISQDSLVLTDPRMYQFGHFINNKGKYKSFKLRKHWGFMNKNDFKDKPEAAFFLGKRYGLEKNIKLSNWFKNNNNILTKIITQDNGNCLTNTCYKLKYLTDDAWVIIKLK